MATGLINKVYSMKKLKSLIIIIVSSAVMFSCSKTKNPSGEAVLNFMAGDVSILNKGLKSPARVGDIIVQGMKIFTGKNSFADIKIGANLIRILERSEVSIAELIYNPATDALKSELKLDSGKVYSSLPGKLLKGNHFNIKTPTVTAAVRGTEFLVQETSGNSLIACASGQMAVSSMTSEKQVILNAGEQVAAQNGKILKVEKIPAKEMKEYARIKSDIDRNREPAGDNGAAKDEIKAEPQGLEPDKLNPDKKMNFKK